MGKLNFILPKGELPELELVLIHLSFYFFPTVCFIDFYISLHPSENARLEWVKLKLHTTL